MGRNLVVICLDSVRKDYFDRFAPRLQRHAATSFEFVRAASSWSSPSHASMLTGLLPHRHGVHAEHNDFAEVSVEDTVVGDLPDYRSVGVSANVFASPRFGFDRFFDTFHEVPTGCRYPEGLDANRFFLDSDATGPRVVPEYLGACFRHDYPLRSFANGVEAGFNVLTRDAPIPKLVDDGASAVSRTVLDVVEESREPFFLFVNYTDAHVPLRPVLRFDGDLYSAPYRWSTDDASFWEVVEDPTDHEQYLEYHRELYGAAIDYLDRQVSRLVESIDRSTARETTVVVTADHGENLGTPEDEGLIGHKSSLSESLLHVPLLLINPPAGRIDHPKEPGYFSHLSLRALLHRLADGEVPDLFADRLPAEVVGMSPGPDPNSRSEYWNRMLRCVYEGTNKIVWDSEGTVKTYRIDPDRPCWQEMVDGDGSVPGWAADFFETDVETFKDAVTNEGRSPATQESLDPFTRQRLDDLGYL